MPLPDLAGFMKLQTPDPLRSTSTGDMLTTKGECCR
jgi:hypothetical protein